MKRGTGNSGTGRRLLFQESSLNSFWKKKFSYLSFFKYLTSIVEKYLVSNFSMLINCFFRRDAIRRHRSTKKTQFVPFVKNHKTVVLAWKSTCEFTLVKKPNTCLLCSKAFTQSSTLKNLVKIHYEVKKPWDVRFVLESLKETQFEGSFNNSCRAWILRYQLLLFRFLFRHLVYNF